MKQKLIALLILISMLGACRKGIGNKQQITGEQNTLSLEEVKKWYTVDTAANINWNAAEHLQNKQKDYWLVNISGRPTFQKLQLGYRRLLFYRDSSRQIQERLLEVIPDGLYLQRTGHVSPEDFTGRIFMYNKTHQLLGGKTFNKGVQVGIIKTATTSSGSLHTDLVDVNTNCTWVDNNYVDSEGNAVIYSEKICTTTVSDDGATGILDGGTSTGSVGSGNSGGGGGVTGPIPPVEPPTVSNLPGETGDAIKPADFIKCFGNIPDKGATTKVTVYVQEPWPGTSFNMGLNSVGHTAIGLTKTNGTQSVTQVLGFYPDATGLAKIHAPSKIVNNGGDLEYNVSISYTVSAETFKKISDYVANPPATYDLVGFNCTGFVDAACKAGNLILPNPVTIVGAGDMVAGPGGLGSSIERLKGQSNVNTNGGTTPISKGPCK
jgi:hypothetical protein